jgi:enoyl-CoA hydratase
VTDDVEFARQGRIGLITLNRPKALNALNLPMIRAMRPQLADWADDPAVEAVVIRGAGDRAFCAGGDVRAVYEDGLAMKRGESDGALTRDFFREEYQLNHQIHTFPKPYLALVNGVSMGGGVGLSVHGDYRVVTESLMFAMPETGIGLFPDVGAGWFLPRCPGELGTYFALTGARGGPAEAIALGYATHHVPFDDLESLIDRLAEGGAARIESVLSDLSHDPGEPDFAGQRDLIDRCFAHDRVEEVIAALEGEEDAFASGLVERFAGLSPTSLKVTLAEMRRCAGLAYEQVVTIEYRLAQGCMARHDFYEGIRALLVDKDKSPKWDPARVSEVDDALVDAHFAEPPEGDLVV